MRSRIASLISWFNSAYDLSARIVKLLLFVVAIVLLLWKWPYIDWGHTSTDLVEKYTPFQVQKPQVRSALPTGAVAPAAPPASSAGRPSQPAPGPPPPSTPTSPSATSPGTDYLGVYQFGQLAFSTDRPYEIKGDTILFDKLLLKGKPDYGKTFLYAGAEIKITHIEAYIGLLVSGGSVEGPVLKGVRCQVVRK